MLGGENCQKVKNNKKRNSITKAKERHNTKATEKATKLDKEVA